MDQIYNFINNNYLIIKSLHVISMVSWMAALLYLPRLFVYHTTVKNKESNELLKIMEYRLQKYIMSPAMVFTLIFGLLLVKVKGIIDWSEIWMYFKLFCVFLLIIFHHLLIKYRKDFFYDKNIHSKKFFKIINEIPTVLLIIIIFLIYLKPF
tara:strand:- start:18150 stop:18605 length:456 start_codon:yes stop_codon:yes gene_type:complete